MQNGSCICSNNGVAMRVWDLPFNCLCNMHLCAMHKEIHQIHHSVLNGGGWKHHPEVKRWKGHLKALKVVHDEVVREMANRNGSSKHKTEFENYDDSDTYPELWESREQQIERLKVKRNIIRLCKCLASQEQ